MAFDLQHSVCHLGHVVSTLQLGRLGANKRMIAAAVEAGIIRRVARGTYACAHLEPPLSSAARAGAKIDCTTSLQRNGVWSGIEQPGLHLRMPPHGHLQRRAPAAVLHWSELRSASAQPLEVSPLDALMQALLCLSPDDALASVESALHLGFVDEHELELLMAWAPARLQSVLAQIDRGAQSGFETHTRVLLVRAGLRVRTQAYVPGSGHFDLLVEECVGLETDGEQWHGPERFIPDRTKDLAAEEYGVRSLRIGRTHIFDSWPRTLAAVRRMVGDAQAAQESRDRAQRKRPRKPTPAPTP
ncbi:hypothetical protein [Leifsonia sp. A12D58]|uniref:hypothetical protein n=1 Tax=Leifsonia sp. A12D58 TaxID=3397674 RepID=UPI0039E0DF15